MYALALYAALSDPEFTVRESAQARLSHLVDRHPAIYGPRLAEWCRDCPSPEARRRLLQVLTAYARWKVNSFVPSGVPVWPICDAYPVACPLIPFALVDVRDRCRWPVESQPGDAGGPYWTAYRRTTERRVRDMLRDGASFAECDALVGRMWRLEQAAKSDCGEKWAEAAGWTRWQGGYPRSP